VYAGGVMRNHTLGLLLFGGFLASCGNLTCDQTKKEAINRMNAGIEFANKGALPSAEKELEAAKSMDPKNHSAAYNLGQVYSQQKKWDKAIDAYSAAITQHDGEPMYHYKLAQAFYEADKLDPAKKEFERAIQLNNRLFKAHWYLGRIHNRQDRPKEAAQSWSEAARLNPKFGKPFVDLGKLYYQWEMFREAESVLSQAACEDTAGSKEDDNCPLIREAEDLTNAYYYLGMTFESQKQWDKAIEQYKKAVETKGKTENVEARLQLGRAYFYKGDLNNAKKYLEEFIKMGGGANPFNLSTANDLLAKIVI
jgi:tetratricopeptide (TPR) repeat protein